MIADDVQLEDNVVIYHPDLVNLYGCRIGDGSKIGAFVEIRRDVSVGKNVKAQAFAFIPESVVIEDEVFIGPYACFTNDKYPLAVNPDGSLMTGSDWYILPTLVKTGARLGTNCTILCGLAIGEVGAGATVTTDIVSYSLAVGSPAHVVGDVRGKLVNLDGRKTRSIADLV